MKILILRLLKYWKRNLYTWRDYTFVGTKFTVLLYSTWFNLQKDTSKKWSNEVFCSVQLFSHVRLATPWTTACWASPSITNYQSLLKLMPDSLALHARLCGFTAFVSRESEWALACSSMVTSYGSRWYLPLGDLWDRSGSGVYTDPPMLRGT